MSAAAIEVRGVCVSYRSMRSGSIKKLLRGYSGSGVVNALNGVTFDVDEGEVLGVVGSNGGGKSTLLRTIAGIFVPDSGTIDLHGSSCSLLAIGVGFVGALSGRENIMLTGLLMGFSKDEVKAREQEIISYSELGEAIDNPVRTYSSGMYSRLAFAITVILRTEVVLIDEVLSVGDEHFKEKSRKSIERIIEGGAKTVVIVSHELEDLRQVCTRAMWLEGGSIVDIGPADRLIDSYARQCDVTSCPMSPMER